MPSHCIRTDPVSSARSPTDRHRACFPTLDGMNDAAVNMGVQRSLPDNDVVSFGSVPSTGVAGSFRGSVLNSLRNFRTVFHSGCTGLHSHQEGTRFSFPHILANTGSLDFLILAVLTDRGEVTVHRGF